MPKGELSITTVVIAAIALIVLIVVVVVFSGRMTIFGENIASCASKGGYCASTVSEPVNEAYRCELGDAPLKKTDCHVEGTTDVCCIPIIEREVKNNE